MSLAGDFPPDPLLSSGSFNTTAGADQVHPSPINWARQAESNSRKRAAPGDSWLPPGWRIEDKVRTSGATAGIRDRYYYSPGGHKFRSKTEVLHYLEHGTLKKGTRKAVNTNFHSDKFEGQGSPKVSKKVKEAPVPFNFDFESPPEKVSWAMTKAGEEAWAPYIGDDKVQDSVRRDWINAFKMFHDWLTNISDKNQNFRFYTPVDA
ncbi:hypothetical protein AALP_AA8G387100 [Arabis alpina]|uniref:MBD domain-containing protein n=1 Tax=Arabis alpina TaxID=50452 RepID=A0A087GC65_ARAAL|nr:hypothetical protein AALP_AA8G387100 [Arabis alpina]